LYIYADLRHSASSISQIPWPYPVVGECIRVDLVDFGQSTSDKQSG